MEASFEEPDSWPLAAAEDHSASAAWEAGAGAKRSLSELTAMELGGLGDGAKRLHADAWAAKPAGLGAPGRVSPYTRIRVGAMAAYGRDAGSEPVVSESSGWRLWATSDGRGGSLSPHAPAGRDPASASQRVPPPRPPSAAAPEPGRPARPPTPPPPPPPPPRAGEAPQAAGPKELLKPKSNGTGPSVPRSGKATTLMVPADLLRRLQGDQGERLAAVQEQSGAEVEVLDDLVVASCPEDRLLKLSGPLGARHSAVELLLRALWGEDGSVECTMRLLVAEGVVGHSSNDGSHTLKRVSHEHGVRTDVAYEEVGAKRMAISTTSGPLSCVTTGAWEMMKALDSAEATAAASSEAAPVDGAAGASPAGAAPPEHPAAPVASVAALLPALSMAERPEERLRALRRHCPSVELRRPAAWPDEVLLTLTGTPLQRATGLDRALAATFPRDWCALRLLLSADALARALAGGRAAALRAVAEASGGEATVVEAPRRGTAAKGAAGGQPVVAGGNGAGPAPAEPGSATGGEGVAAAEGGQDFIIQATGRRRLVIAVAEAIMRRMDGREC